MGRSVAQALEFTYTRWISAQALELRGLSISNAGTDVQRPYMTPTPLGRETETDHKPPGGPNLHIPRNCPQVFTPCLAGDRRRDTFSLYPWLIGSRPIPGDGIGTEVVEQAPRVLEATGVEVDTTEFNLGAARYNATGRCCPTVSSKTSAPTTRSCSAPSATPACLRAYSSGAAARCVSVSTIT